jgi:hypothetical protein
MSGRQAIRVITEALIDGWKFDVLNNQVLQFLPASHDIGSVAFGSATDGWDVKFYLGGDGSVVCLDNGNKEMVLNGVALNTDTPAIFSNGATITNATIQGNATTITNATIQGTNTTFNATIGGNSILTGIFASSGAGGQRHKTTDVNTNTTFNTSHYNGFVTNRGSFFPVVYTLPDVATSGDWFIYWGVSAVDVTFKSATPDRLNAGFNDTTADSIVFDVVGEQAGAVATAFFDGVQWTVQPVRGGFTVNT